MENTASADQNEHNPISRQRHTSEVLWQITLPLIICAVGLLAISVLAVELGQVDARRWGSISLIWLILPAMLVVLIVFLLLVAGILGALKIIQVIPGAAFRLQKVLNRVDDVTTSAGNWIAEPFIRLHLFSSAIGSLMHQVSRRHSNAE
jgi:hypothetical protein